MNSSKNKQISSILAALAGGVSMTGDVRGDMLTFLHHHGHPRTSLHMLQVAGEARQLALRFGADPAGAEVSGWLHDISVVIPDEQRPGMARRLGIEILSEEEQFPLLVHQKLSAFMAHQIFGVTDRAVLSAIGCHTTLKKDATLLDKVVFVADKLRWDQSGEPPYLSELLAGLEQSLDLAALSYLEHLWQQRDHLPGPLHPWAVAALEQLRVSKTEFGVDRADKRSTAW